MDGSDTGPGGLRTPPGAAAAPAVALRRRRHVRRRRHLLLLMVTLLLLLLLCLLCTLCELLPLLMAGDAGGMPLWLPWGLQVQLGDYCGAQRGINSLLLLRLLRGLLARMLCL